jgi:hypothetical protein
LLFLSIIALILDIIIFTEGKIFYSIEDNKEGFKENNDNKVSPSLPAAPQASQQTSPQTVSGKAISLIFNKYKDINDIILNKIKEYTEKNYNKNTSVNVYIR